jgi:hypothetical protein
MLQDCDDSATCTLDVQTNIAVLVACHVAPDRNARCIRRNAGTALQTNLHDKQT